MITELITSLSALQKQNWDADNSETRMTLSYTPLAPTIILLYLNKVSVNTQKVYLMVEFIWFIVLDVQEQYQADMALWQSRKLRAYIFDLKCEAEITNWKESKAMNL